MTLSEIRKKIDECYNTAWLALNAETTDELEINLRKLLKLLDNLENNIWFEETFKIEGNR